MRFKTHLFLPWVADIVRLAPMLDAVEDVIGPNILCWSSAWAIKPARSTGFFSWHQDSLYAGIAPVSDVVVAWLAFTPSNAENGCVRYLPESHLQPLPHTDTFEQANLLSRGQSISGIDKSSVVDAVLAPGEFALHHFQCAHGSLPNRTGEPRVGIQIIYMAPRCRKSRGTRSECASLVRGADDCGYWELESAPREPMGEEELVAHRRSMELEKSNYFADSKGRQGYHK